MHGPVLCPLLRQCWQWTIEAPDELRDKMLAALGQLRAALPAAPPAALREKLARDVADGAATSADVSRGGGGRGAGESSNGAVADASSSSAEGEDELVPEFPVEKADVDNGTDDELYL